MTERRFAASPFSPSEEGGVFSNDRLSGEDTMTPIRINHPTTDPTSGWATFDDLESVYGEKLDAITAEAYPRSDLRRTRLHAEGRDNLSRCVSALWKFGQSSVEAWDDLAAFHAPQECYGDVGRSLDRQAEQIAIDHGFASTDAVYEALLSRVAYHAAYELSVLWVR